MIESIEELLGKLDEVSSEEYKELGALVNISPDKFAKYAHFSNIHYTRNCIKRTDKYELILLCWEPGQSTPIHCHNGEECWVYMIQGSMQEQHFIDDNGQPILKDIHELKPLDKSFMCDDFGYHTLENNGSTRAMTLHLYIEPINECSIYEDNSGEFKMVDLSYYSMEGKVLEPTI